jgi:hypothetical protein
LDAVRDVIDISLCDRFHDRMVGGDIDLEDGPIDRLRRIMLGVVASGGIVL